MTRRRAWLAALTLLCVGGAALVWLGHGLRDQGTRQRLFAEARIPLRVSNPVGAALTLYRAGTTAADRQAVELTSGETWLAIGNYTWTR